MKPLKEWKEYIKFADKCINHNSINQYTLSNLFLHPIRPLVQINRILVDLNNISLYYKLRLRTKFFINLLEILFNFFKVNNEKTFLENKKEICKKNYDVIFVTHLNNEIQFKSSVDHYFGSLINETCKKGLSVLLIFKPHIQSNKKEFIKYLKKKKGYDSYLLDEKCIGFKEKFKTLISLIKERKKFLALSRNTFGYSSKLALYTAESFLSKNNFCNFIYGLQIGEIVHNTKSKNIVTTFEGHNWERLFYYFSRKNNSLINCIGFQHTIIFKYQHSVTRVIKKEFDPDYILSSGEISTAFFNKKIAEQITVKTFGSPKTINPTKRKINTNNKILFLPSGEENETYFFIKFAFNFARKYPDLNILIRFHPIVNFKKFIKKLPKIENFNISKSEIEYDSQQCRYVIYSTSTAVFESISLGCIPIRLYWDSINDLSDPLWQIKSKLIKSVNSQSKLHEIIDKNKYSINNEVKLNQIFLKLNQDLEQLRLKSKISVLYKILKK